MATFKGACPHCGAAVTLTDADIGTGNAIKCPHCRRTYTAEQAAKMYKKVMKAATRRGGCFGVITTIALIVCIVLVLV